MANEIKLNFMSYCSYFEANGDIHVLVERRPEEPSVTSSNLVGTTILNINDYVFSN